MAKTEILGTGLDGLVGSRLVELLSLQFDFVNLSRKSGTDITNSEVVMERFKSCSSHIILHLAAKTDVDGCEDDKSLGEDGEAWRVNVEGTQNIVTAAQKTGKKIIFISTDFVFDGTKNFFLENDNPNPVNWYGETKLQAEEAILKADLPSIIIRIASPYMSQDSSKKDFVHRIISLLQRGEKISAVTDHTFTPTYIDDIAQALPLFIGKDLNGIYHLAGSQILSPFDAAILIAQQFGLNKNLISETTRMEFFTKRDRAFRPRNLALKSDKIAELGIKMRSFEEGLREFKIL